MLSMLPTTFDRYPPNCSFFLIVYTLSHARLCKSCATCMQRVRCAYQAAVTVHAAATDKLWLTITTDTWPLTSHFVAIQPPTLCKIKESLAECHRLDLDIALASVGLKVTRRGQASGHAELSQSRRHVLSSIRTSSIAKDIICSRLIVGFSW